MVDQDESLADPAVAQGGSYLRSDVLEAASASDVEPKFLTIGFHDLLLIIRTPKQAGGAFRRDERLYIEEVERQLND